MVRLSNDKTKVRKERAKTQTMINPLCMIIVKLDHHDHVNMVNVPHLLTCVWKQITPREYNVAPDAASPLQEL